jgi:hypothetical protein
MFGIVSIIFIFLTWEFFKSVLSADSDKKQEKIHIPVVTSKPVNNGGNSGNKKCSFPNCRNCGVITPGCTEPRCPGRS